MDANGYQFGDAFDDAAAAPNGWADRQWSYRYEVAGQEIVEGALMPLQVPAHMNHQELADLHYALAIADERSHVYSARRHIYLGVPVVTVSVSVGQPGWGAVRTEEYEGADRFIAFAVECRKSARAVLETIGKKMVEQLAAQAMAEVLLHLKAKENRHE